MSLDSLAAIAEGLRADLSARNAARDKALVQSRELIRHCAECIRAVHRREWDNADQKLILIRTHAQDMRSGVAQYPDLMTSGYIQDALKELVEAHAMNAMIRGLPLPTPSDLKVESAIYLNGLSEAATELRRFILDAMRRSSEHSADAERLLEWMDAIYDQMVTFDFPDALTGGLRRQTDVLRGVLERTRGDLTTSLRQQVLQEALAKFESRFGVSPSDVDES
jgi:translin